MNIFNKFVDIEDESSFTTKIRRENFEIFKKLVSLYRRKVRVLDLGGTQEYWEMMEYIDPNIIDVTIINKEEIKVSLPNFKAIKMNVFMLNNSDFINFDIIFSHSLIEHIDHKRFAKIISDSGKSYFIQTPNKNFPIEPHFLIPLFQYFPLWLKMLCTKSFRKELLLEVESINLLNKSELKNLFKNSTIDGRKLFIFVQSFVVYKYEKK